MKLEITARNALAAHDTLSAANEREPERNGIGMPLDADAWTDWYENVYKPAYETWNKAMNALDAVNGEPVGRHPFTFRPLCEQLIARAAGLVAMRDERRTVEPHEPRAE